jgi:hypothetical protein
VGKKVKVTRGEGGEKGWWWLVSSETDGELAKFFLTPTLLVRY